MRLKSHCVDDQGFDYMANAGREGKDRDTVGLILAVIIMVFLTFAQYMNWY